MNKKTLLSSLPKVDELINDTKIKALFEIYPRITIVDSIRNQIDILRKKILNLNENKIEDFIINVDHLIENVILEIEKKNQMSLKRVINGTGVILHTNLGRALISDDAKKHLIDVACNYSTLEFDLSTGERGLRYSHVDELLCKLTGAEAAMVVNNNAAAVLLVLNTLAKDKEVLVSRGQLVEIGGSFRVPEVMAQSGARLVEVGTTNKTHLSDYENNIHEDTAAILKVHTSNYRILGFTKEVDIEELVNLGRKYDIPVIEDIGSGTLIDFSQFGLKKEPTVIESIKKGADIVTFSGDKLLGGPQAGIIIGKKEYIDRMKRNQLTRAVRVDKLTLVALEATLRLYLDEKKAIKEIPTIKMITAPIHELKDKAEILYKKIKERVDSIHVEIIDGYSQIGGGALPLEELPTFLVAITPGQMSVNKFEEELRKYNSPIIARISDEKVLLDVRTIKMEEFDTIAEAIETIERR